MIRSTPLFHNIAFGSIALVSLTDKSTMSETSFSKNFADCLTKMYVKPNQSTLCSIVFIDCQNVWNQTERYSLPKVSQTVKPRWMKPEWETTQSRIDFWKWKIGFHQFSSPRTQSDSSNEIKAMKAEGSYWKGMIILCGIMSVFASWISLSVSLLRNIDFLLNTDTPFQREHT